MGFLAIFVAETGFRIIRTVQAVGADILFVPRDRLPFFHNILVMESPVKQVVKGSIILQTLQYQVHVLADGNQALVHELRIGAVDGFTGFFSR